MRFVFSASHLLHWRSLIPVAIELRHRGHEIVIETNRANWRGMPTYQMALRPTNVTGVNQASLAWLAGTIGFGQEWGALQESLLYVRYFVPEEFDAAVSTTKNMHFLEDMTLDVNGYMTAYAVGYQHFPGIINVGDYAWVDKLLGKDAPPPMPEVFTGTHAFGAAHGFGKLALKGRATPCGFPHLDKVRGTTGSQKQTVLIQHPGGHRGITDQKWLMDIIDELEDIGRQAVIVPHFIPGLGYDRHGLTDILQRMCPGGAWTIVGRWWDSARGCAMILTTGSSAAYEMWSVGLTNVFILGYVGGDRHKKFELFKDLIVESPEALRRLLRGLPESAKATDPLTREVMEAYRSIHTGSALLNMDRDSTGQGAKTAADVIEGQR